MGSKRRTVITVETRRLTVVRAGRCPPVLAWCERCGGRVRMVTPEQAAALAGTRPRAIYRRVESGDLHFVETGAGALLICSGSL
ncbi:MAG: hypothetical protein ACRD68_05015 [Pyrinomonadaceae bacterium]